MPKIVDHELRKIRIAEAAWKVIVQSGLEHATVRKIAKESGLSVGSLRYYFPTQAELLLFSMELVSERVKERIQAHLHQPKADPLTAIKDVIGEMLPLDDERRVETEVWFVFSAKALVDLRLRQLNEQVYTEMSNAFKRVIQFLQQVGLVRADLQAEREAKRLHALVDGLALHHLMHPEKLTKQAIIDILQHHLRTLQT